MLLAYDRPGPRRRVSPFGCSVALHLCVLTALAYPLSSLAIGELAPKAASDPIVVFTTPSMPALEGASEPGTPDEAATVPEDLGIELPAGATSLSVEGFTFDFATVVGRAAALFPFLELPFLDDLARSGRDDHRAPLTNPLLQLSEPGAAASPLVLTESEIQALTDEAWSRRHRWQAFHRIVALANRHSADVGRLPDLLRAYVDQNLLQLFVDSSIRDPRLWAQLSVAADHRDFVAFIVAYASQHPGTKARTELLFLLDKLAQSNHHA